MRKPGGRNANLKLATFLFHHGWKCTLDWKITGVHDTVHLLAGQEKHKDEYKDTDVFLLKIKKKSSDILNAYVKAPVKEKV